MTARPVDWTPLATSDPVPGDPVALRRAVSHYGAVATAIEQAASRLRTLAAGLDASSQAVDTLRESAADVAKDISRAHERYAGVATALQNYVPHLESAQDASERLLLLARTADDEACDARRLAAAAADRAGTLPPGIDAPERAEQNRQDCLAADAAGRLAQAHRDLADVIEAWDSARRTATNLIKDVHGSGGLKDGWRDNFGGFVNRFVAPILPALNQLSAAVGFAALALAWVPFLGPALGTAALVLTGLSLLANLAMVVGKESGWGPAVVAALGLATFGLSKIAAARYISQAGGARGAARAAAGRWAGKSPAVRGQAGLPADTNSARAISKMMGGGTVQTRDAAARAAAKAQSETWRSTSHQVLRNTPRQAWDDLKGIRQFDVGHPLQGARFDARALAGERAMMPAKAGVMGVHPVIRESPEVALFMDRMNKSDLAFATGTVGGGMVWSYETWTMDNPSTAAERLNLSEHGALTASGQ